MEIHDDELERFELIGALSHFAPLQRPGHFNAALLAFVEEIYRDKPKETASE